MEARMDTKGIIIEAMRKLLAERGFHKITVQDILDAAHCSRGTFYRHFRDKYDIMNYFYLQIGKEILSDPEMDGKAKTEAILDAVLTHRDYFRGDIGYGRRELFQDFCCHMRQAVLFVHLPPKGRSQSRYSGRN